MREDGRCIFHHEAHEGHEEDFCSCFVVFVSFVMRGT